MNKPETKHRLRPNWSMLISIAGLTLLSFVVGTSVAEFNLFPYPQVLKPTYQSLRFRYGEREFDWTEFWQFAPARSTAKGVTTNTSEAFPGYTLYVASNASGATLIDLDGHEVHRWTMPFYSVWPDPKHISERVPEESIYSSHVHLYPNGDLLLNYCASGVTPFGYGLAKVDKDSKLLWSYPGRVHHTFDVAPDGTIYALTHEYRRLTESDRPQQLTTDIVLDDFVVVLSPEGKELQKISLFDAAWNSPEFRSLIFTYNGWDVLHTNAVRVIPEEFASHNSFCRAGQLLLSFRSSDALAVLDVEQGRIAWAKVGFWKQQHCPTFLPDGRMMIFDNQGFATRIERFEVLRTVEVSRVVEFNPSTNEMVWEYHGSPEAPLYSKYRGGEQKLPNGNVLITESDSGRIFEVTPEKNIVWDFHIPDRKQQDGQECIWNISLAQRLAVDECKFLSAKPGN